MQTEGSCFPMQWVVSKLFSGLKYPTPLNSLCLHHRHPNISHHLSPKLQQPLNWSPTMHLCPLSKSVIHTPWRVIFSTCRSDHVNLLSLLPEPVLKTLKASHSFQRQNSLLWSLISHRFSSAYLSLNFLLRSNFPHDLSISYF